MGNKGLISAVLLLAALGVYLILITGCASPTGPDASAVAAGNLLAHQIWCDDNAPLRPSMAEVDGMTRPQLDAMNAHNERGVKWCGWSP